MIAILRTAAVALVLVLAACGETAEDAPPADEPTTEPTEDAAGTQPEGQATVAVASTGLGDVLVDAEGMTLYIFDPDEQGDPTCNDACAEAWPPLLVDGLPTPGDGVDESLVGTATRADGSTQATYNGWPLYRWASDQAPGDTTGQGVNEVWWVIAPDGEPVREG